MTKSPSDPPVRSRLDSATITKLAPGEWLWDGGIGFRRNRSGAGGSWYIKYRAPMPSHLPTGMSPPTRQVKERLPNCRNRSQAEGVLMARRSAVFDGTYRRLVKAEPLSLRSFAPRFLESKRHLRTAHKYRQQLAQHILPRLGGLLIGAISSRDCLAYYNERLDSDAAISTVNGEMACLKSLFSTAVSAGHAAINPVRGIKLINPNNGRDRILSAEETARLFSAAADAQDFVRPLFHVLLHTGMRLGEALALEWRDVEFENQRIVIRRAKSGEGRKVPLRPLLAEELILWRTRGQGARWVFPARGDMTNPMQSIRKGWLRLCASADVSSLRPHDLRHNFTSALQANGVSDSIIMAITGHKTHVMLHRYSHAADASKRDAVDSLPEPLRSTDVATLRFGAR